MMNIFKSKRPADGGDSTVLAVSGMTCNHCVMRVKTALSQVAGVHSAEVDLSAGQAVIHGTARVEDLIAAVVAAGYGAEVSGETPAGGHAHGQHGDHRCC